MEPISSKDENTPLLARNNSCDFLGVDMRQDMTNTSKGTLCGARQGGSLQILVDDGTSKGNLHTTRSGQGTRVRNNSMSAGSHKAGREGKWGRAREDKNVKALKAVAIQTQEYEVHGILIKEFKEPQIEKRFQNWLDLKYASGVDATVAASLVWFIFASNWVVAFHDQGDVLWHVLTVHLLLSAWQFFEFVMMKVVQHPWYTHRRFQNYILWYTVVFEAFVVVEFTLIAHYTQRDEGHHQMGHNPEVHNPWLVTCLFVVLLGFKAGFFHMKIRYYLIAAALDLIAFACAYGVMVHLIHYKDMVAQLLVLLSVVFTGVVAALQHNRSNLVHFENEDKANALLATLEQETREIAEERRRQKELLEKNQIMISYKHADSEFAFKVRDALVAKGYKIWIDEAIRPGEDWRAEIGQAIAESQALLFCVSPLAVQSKYCREELYFASGCKVPIFPLKYKDAFADLKGGVKLILQRIQWADFESKTDPEFEEAVGSLVKRLDDSLSQLSSENKAAQLIEGVKAGLIQGDVQGGNILSHEDIDKRMGLTCNLSQADYEHCDTVYGSDTILEDDLLDAISSDVFICCEPETDSGIGRALHKELTARRLNVAPLVDNNTMEQGQGIRNLDFRDRAMASLEKSGCMIFVQTRHALQAEHGYCPEMVHCAYESNCPIIVLIVEDGDMSHSLSMMLQMAPKLEIDFDFDSNSDMPSKEDTNLPSIDPSSDPHSVGLTRVPTGFEPDALDGGVMERVLFEIMHVKYAAVREAELVSALEPPVVDVAALRRRRSAIN